MKSPKTKMPSGHGLFHESGTMPAMLSGNEKKCKCLGESLGLSISS